MFLYILDHNFKTFFMETTSYASQAPILHPDAKSINTLGILGLVFCILFGLVGLICGIICLAKAPKALRDISNNPGKYTDESLSKIKGGKTCAIIGLSIQGFALLIVVIAAVANA